MVYKTGDIYYVKFSPAHGSLLGGVRPAYILREFPELGVVTVAPITTIQSGGNPSWRIPLLAGQCGMSVASTICIDMMRAVTVDQVDRKICEAPDRIRALVDERCPLRPPPVRREQVERVWRGEWITPTIIGGRAYNIPHCSACNGVPCGTDEHTRFCAHCGAPITDEAVEMVMERLEALKDGSTSD